MAGEVPGSRPLTVTRELMLRPSTVTSISPLVNLVRSPAIVARQSAPENTWLCAQAGALRARCASTPARQDASSSDPPTTPNAAATDTPTISGLHRLTPTSSQCLITARGQTSRCEAAGEVRYGAGVPTISQIRGYVLEEALAWLLRNSGYQLIVAPSPNSGLAAAGAGLTVRGRGAEHQADVLGDFAFTPPFSLPIRMFVEAKYYGRARPVGLHLVRNAWATVADINEFQVPAGPHGQYRYVYALFSRSGFTGDAQRFALAHQISLVDLSLPMFGALRQAVRAAADGALPHIAGAGGIGAMRAAFRAVLETAPPSAALAGSAAVSAAVSALSDVAAAMRASLEAYNGGEFLLAFPPAPFILTLTGTTPQSIEQFTGYAARHPEHDVHLRRDSAPESGSPQAGRWLLSPAEAPTAYTLTFSLPEHVDGWITDEADGRANTRWLKRTLLSAIIIYRWVDEVPKVYQLRYTPQRRAR